MGERRPREKDKETRGKEICTPFESAVTPRQEHFGGLAGDFTEAPEFLGVILCHRFDDDVDKTYFWVDL